MATAGDIVVNLTANSTQFNAGLKSAQGALSGFNSAIKVAGAAIAGFLSFQAIKGGIGTLSDVVKRIDDIGDEAKKIGVTTDFLSELQHAAKMSDVSIDSLTNGFRKMEVTLGQAGFTGDPAEAFLEIADAVKNTKGQFEQAALAAKIFGSRGIGNELLPLLKQGRSGIMALGAEARALGVSFDDEVAAKIDGADDAFKRMDASMEGLKATVAIELAPIFTDTLAPAILDITQKTREWITSSEGVETMTDAWNTFADTISGIADGFVVAKTALVNFGKAMGGVADFAAKRGMGLGDMAGLALGIVPPGLIGKGEGGKGVGEDWNAIFDQINFEEPEVFGERIGNFMKGLGKGAGPPPGAPGAGPEPFAFPAPKEIVLKGPTTFKTGETDLFSKEGFSIFARAVNGPSMDISKQQLDVQKKIEKGQGDIVNAINNIPEPAGPGEEF